MCLHEKESFLHMQSWHLQVAGHIQTLHHDSLDYWVSYSTGPLLPYLPIEHNARIKVKKRGERTIGISRAGEFQHKRQHFKN